MWPSTVLTISISEFSEEDTGGDPVVVSSDTVVEVTPCSFINGIDTGIDFPS